MGDYKLDYMNTNNTNRKKIISKLEDIKSLIIYISENLEKSHNTKVNLYEAEMKLKKLQNF